jgi:ankyrin repeat protein
MLFCLLSLFVSFFQLLIYVCLLVGQIGWTPLHEASYYGHIEVVRLLLDRGADIQAQTEVSEG